MLSVGSRVQASALPFLFAIAAYAFVEPADNVGLVQVLTGGDKPTFRGVTASSCHARCQRRFRIFQSLLSHPTRRITHCGS